MDKKRDDRTNWRCTDKTSSGRLNFVNDATVTSTESHSHPAAPAENSLRCRTTPLRSPVQTPYYIRTNKRDTFLIWDSTYTVEGSRSFLFGTVDNFNLLAPHLVIDGTFSTSPNLFKIKLTDYIMKAGEYPFIDVLKKEQDSTDWKITGISHILLDRRSGWTTIGA